MVQPLWKTVWRFLKKLKTELLYVPANPLLDMYPEKYMAQKDTCTAMVTKVLFIKAKTCMQPKCSSREHRIKKMCMHQREWLLSKSLQAINAGEGVEKREPSYTVDGNAN